MRDLYHATRDELIRLVLAQQELLAAQEQRMGSLERQVAAQQATIGRLTAQLGALVATDEGVDGPPGPPTGMPGLKPTETPAREASPRRKRPRTTARHRLTSTAHVIHALDRCPDCGAPLAGGTVKRTREVLELPAPTVVVTEHV